MYDSRIVAILTANDDGSQPATDTAPAIALSVKLANDIYNPHGVNFLFDPATDVYRMNDDLLNRDCSRRDNEIYTQQYTPTGKDNDPARVLPELNAKLYNDHRNEIARKFPGRIVVFFTAGNRYRWDDDENRWIYGWRNFNWSDANGEFVTMQIGSSGTTLLAHEIGHYLNLGHTFGYQPENLADVEEGIRKYVDEEHHSKDEVVPDLFDPDQVADTPPDPGPALFKNQCDPAETSVTIPVTFADGTQMTYTFTPDRENIMSYWDKTCRGKPAHLTPGQAERVLDALQLGNRQHLIEPAVLYYGLWTAGDKSQTRAIAWAIEHFAKRFDNELSAGRRCVHMQAYDIGGNRIRYDGIWEDGGNRGQTSSDRLGRRRFREAVQ